MKRQAKGSQDGKGSSKKLRKESDNGESESRNIEQANVNENEIDPEINLDGDKEETKEGGGPPKKKKEKSSWVWNYFNIRLSDDQKTEYAHCIYCPSKYKLSGKANGGTGNCNVHLLGKHRDKIPEGQKTEKEKFEFSQERYREALVKWIVLSTQPFSECEVESFLKMIATLNPEAITISKETVKRDIMKKFEEVVQEIKTKLSKSPAKFSFTVDAWTSKNVYPFLAIRAHWINADWEYETVLLDFYYIEGKHNGANFCNIFLDCLKRFDIPLSKVLGVTVDNAGNNDTLIDGLQKYGIKVGTHISSKENRVRCMPHILNLSVQDILKALRIPLSTEVDEQDNQVEEGNNSEELDGDEEEIAEIDAEEGDETGSIGDNDKVEEEEEEILDENQFTVAKLRRLVKKIKKSTQMRQKLQKLCLFYKVKPLVPIIDVATRWNSTYEMIERAAFLKVPLRALCSNEKSLKKYLTTETEWIDLNSLKTLLSKFDRATKLMSMERHPTLCSYLPTLNWLLESLETFIAESTGLLADAASKGLEKLKKYEEELRVNKSQLPYVAVFLNPSLKMSYFKEHGYSKPSIREIQKTISDLFEKTYGINTTNAGDDNAEEEEEKDEFFEHMHKRAANKEPKEFQKYLHFPLSAPKVNVLQYWRSQAEEFPNLSNMARDHLAVQSSAVAVERDNSAGADLVTANRCSLLPQTIRACMCLKSWLKNLIRSPAKQTMQANVNRKQSSN